MKLKILTLTGLLAAMLLTGGLATHVDPTGYPGSAGNQGCDDLEPEGADWSELKIDPPEDGVYSTSGLSVTVDFHDNSESEPKTFDWTATEGAVVAVYVKAGNSDQNGGHNLYEYDPAETSDTGLTSPQASDKNAISHVTFCFVEADEQTCEDDPEQDRCQPPCEENPEQQQCDLVCPDVALMATPLENGSVQIDMTTDGPFDLYRTQGVDTVLMGTFDADQSIIDDDTVAGNTYTYAAVSGPALCAEVEVTAIPVFPTVMASLAAIGAASLAYVGLRRRG